MGLKIFVNIFYNIFKRFQIYTIQYLAITDLFHIQNQRLIYIVYIYTFIIQQNRERLINLLPFFFFKLFFLLPDHFFGPVKRKQK